MMSLNYCERKYRRTLLKRGSLGLLIFFLVFLFLELFSRWIAVISTAPFGENIRNDQKMMVSDSIKTGEIIALGDSIIARSFYPELFSSLLSKKLSKPYEVYNLGIDGSGIEQSRASLRYLLSKKIKPLLVVMNVSVHNLNLTNFTFDSDDRVHFDEEDRNSLDYYSRCFVLEHRTSSGGIYCKAAKMSYFLRMVHYYHQQFNHSLQAFIHTQKWRTSNLFSGYPAITIKGFSPTFNILPEESINTLMYVNMKKQYTRAFSRFKLSTKGLDIIVDELNANGIKTVLVLAPMYQPLMRKIYDDYGLPSNKTIEDTLKQYALKKNIAFINLFEHYQNLKYFEDPVHLNIHGAIKFTSELADKILHKELVASQGYLDREIFDYLKKDVKVV